AGTVGGAAVQAGDAAAAIRPAGLAEHPGGRLGGAVGPDLAIEGATAAGQLEPVPGAHAPGEAVGVPRSHAVVEELHGAGGGEGQFVALAAGRVVDEADADLGAGAGAIDADLGGDGEAGGEVRAAGHDRLGAGRGTALAEQAAGLGPAAAVDRPAGIDSG